MTVVIVDDEPAGRRTLRDCCASQPGLNVIGEYADSRVALEALRERPPDLLFLDVQMAPLTGIAVARALDTATLPQIVFVTAYDRFALAAFEVSAVDYIVKPFGLERFQIAANRARRRHKLESLAQRQASLTGLLQQLEQGVQALREPRARVMVESGGRMQVLDVALVETIEADRNYVRLTVGRECFTTRSTLQHAETAMASQPMIKISRSCLVNGNHIRELSRTPRGDIILLMAGGATVTSSERYRESVRQQLTQMNLWARDA